MGQRHKQAKTRAAAGLPANAPRRALSPRVPAPALQSGRHGTTGRAAPSGHADPTAGRPVAGAPRRAVTQDDRAGVARIRTVRGNTMANARMGGTVRRRASAAEYAGEALTRASAPAIARVAAGSRLVPGMEAKQRLAGESEGLRRREMSRRGVMINNGAIGTREEIMRLGDDDPINTRTIILTVPVWADDPTD